MLRTFKGEREIFIVQVNVDPEGETLSRAEKAGSAFVSEASARFE